MPGSTCSDSSELTVKVAHQSANLEHTEPNTAQFAISDSVSSDSAKSKNSDSAHRYPSGFSKPEGGKFPWEIEREEAQASFNRAFKFPRITQPSEMASRTLNPKAIKALLTNNVDEHATHFALFTTHGTLLGHDEPVHVPTTRSLAALVGLNWRRYAASLSGNSPIPGDVQHVKTLRVTHKKGQPTELQGMIVEWEGLVAAVVEVKERVLLSAQLPIGEFLNEQDALGKRIAGFALAEEGGEEAKAVDLEGGKGKEEDVVPKIRILELRASGMAEAIHEQWPGKMSADFY